MLAIASLSSVLTALSDYLWPLIALGVVIVLMPTIKKVLATRGYSIKVGALDLTVQEASENLQKQISDLQIELSSLKLQTGRQAAVPLSPPAAATAPAAAPALAPPATSGNDLGATAAVPVGVPAATVQGPGFRSILWVDDELVNVAYEISILPNRGVNVITATSTREALGKLAGVEAVVTDSARQEYGQFNSRAGLDLIRLVDEQRPGLPVFIYTLASTAQRIRPEATDLGAAGVFGSSVDIIAALGPPPS